MSLLWQAMVFLIPESSESRYYREVFNKGRFGHDLAWTFAVLGFALICAGVLYAIVWDQRRRCRTCLRRLIMPVEKGSWTNLLLIGPPRIEYICPYGHGTLEVPEVQITGQENQNWTPQEDDIWKALSGKVRK
jgi:hypothetical protein